MEQSTIAQPQVVHPDEARASEMPYAPAVELPAGGVIVFLYIKCRTKTNCPYKS